MSDGKTKQEWVAKKGYWTQMELYEDATGASKWRDIGRDMTGPVPDNNQIITAYLKYLNHATEVCGAGQINVGEYNLKKFVRDDLGNHVTTHKVKAVLKVAQTQLKMEFDVLPVGKQGQPSKTDISAAIKEAKSKYGHLLRPMKTVKKKK